MIFNKRPSPLLFMLLFVVSHYATGQNYESVRDIRDSIVYETIEINGTIWMHDNLSFNISESECFDDNIDNCLKLGCLYTHSQSVDACPMGWHLPTATDWKKLIADAGGSTIAGGLLKAGGITGLNVRMSGMKNKLNFIENGQQTGFWGADVTKFGTAYAVFFYRSDPKVKRGYVSKSDFKLYVRCIKNAE